MNADHNNRSIDVLPLDDEESSPGRSWLSLSAFIGVYRRLIRLPGGPCEYPNYS
jgi:hypothetical protein